MSFDTLNKMVASLNQNIQGQEKLPTLVLQAKLNQAQDTYPHDQTVGLMNRVISDMIKNDKLTIKKSDFRDLYHKLYVRGTVFPELFETEMGAGKYQPEMKKFAREDSNVSMEYQVKDQVLAQALTGLFDATVPVKNYNEKTAQRAVRSVGQTLEIWGLKPAKLQVESGDEHFIVIKAAYDTPKGITNIHVPVEVQQDRIMEPLYFMGNKGPGNLNYQSLRDYITREAGTQNKVNAHMILTALHQAGQVKQELTATEIAVMKLNAERAGHQEYAYNGVMGIKLAHDTAPADVALPELPEAKTFEEKFSSTVGLSQWKFGSKVEQGRQHISRELQGFGFPNHQIIVAGHDDHTIFYGISLNGGTTAFTVPIKVANNQLQKPGVMLCQGSLETFDKTGINRLFADHKTDRKVAAVASTMSALKPSEVLDNLRQALAEENFTKAEDALNVLAQAGDAKAYAVGFQTYLNGLSGKKEATSTCSHMVKHSNHQEMVCSHTNLPISKVYQDPQGFCHPLYRRGMQETYEGAAFTTSKVLL